MSNQNTLLNTLLKTLDDSQATDVKVIDVRKQTTITDYMVICTGRAGRHVKAIANKLMEDMKAAGCPSLSCSGMEADDWVLIDFGDYIVHVMLADSRQFYNLEGLWEEEFVA